MSSPAIALHASVVGRLIKRYKRFLADIELADGRAITAHCPNPGSMLGLDEPGSAVRCSFHDDPKRKLAHTLELVESEGTWVGVNTGRANAIAAAALAARVVPELAGYPTVRAEVPVPGSAPSSRSRLDFVLDGHSGGQPRVWLEVKSVTLRGGGRARFPDAVTARGAKHMGELARLASHGERAALLFVVQRADCEGVEPADEIDPGYGAALRSAAKAGVEVYAVRAEPAPNKICVSGTLPVWL